jgi:hypothetical protein
MLNNPYQELNCQYHYVSQTAVQSISKRSLLSIPRRTSCSSHLWPTCREHGLLSSKHWSAVLPQNSTLVMSFLFQHLDLTRILGQKPSSLAQFCKEGKEFLVSNGESGSGEASLSSWLRWRGPTPRRGRELWETRETQTRLGAGWDHP